MSKKSVKYIREVVKNDKIKKSKNIKGKFYRFCFGGSMKGIKYYSQKFKEMGIKPADVSEEVFFKKLSVLKDVDITTTPSMNIKQEDIF